MQREAETGLTNPMLTQGDWHGKEGVGAFASSQQAYDTLFIGNVKEGRRLQEEARKAAAQAKQLQGQQGEAKA